jgi:hypothetical protein
MERWSYIDDISKGNHARRWRNEMTINLTTFVANAKELRVMEHDAHGTGHDAGSAADVFGARIALIQVGDAQGADDQRGAYEWYPLTINGEAVGELRDDASGLTIHINQP